MDWSSLYIRRLLQKFEMSDCKPIKSPANPGVKLTSSGDDDYVCDVKIYRGLNWKSTVFVNQSPP